MNSKQVGPKEANISITEVLIDRMDLLFPMEDKEMVYEGRSLSLKKEAMMRAINTGDMAALDAFGKRMNVPDHEQAFNRYYTKAVRSTIKDARNNPEDRQFETHYKCLDCTLTFLTCAALDDHLESSPAHK